MKNGTANVLLRTSTVLWVVWGLVHALAGVMTITLDTAAGFQGIADGVPPEAIEANYHGAVGAVLNQHGWNLLWGGLYTVIGALFIWRGNFTAIWTTAVVGGLLDVGYFLFLDLGGYVNFVPGTVMTLVSSAGILLSFSAYCFNLRKVTEASVNT